jgi:protein ImuA
MSVVSLPSATAPVWPAVARERRKAELLAALRRRIEAMESPTPRPGALPVLGFGLAAIDEALPGGGLKPTALHEAVGSAAALPAFAALLAGRRLGQGAAGPVLWCASRAGLYPPGLAAFGLRPERLLLVRAGERRQVLWAMEEALASGRTALVVGEAGRLDLAQSRRLQLAAESGATPAVLLGLEAPAGASAAVTRWRVESAPSGPVAGHRGVGRLRLRLVLARCRGGRPGAWLVEWDDATHTLDLVAVLGDGPALPQAEARRA